MSVSGVELAVSVDRLPVGFHNVEAHLLRWHFVITCGGDATMQHIQRCHASMTRRWSGRVTQHVAEPSARALGSTAP